MNLLHLTDNVNINVNPSVHMCVGLTAICIIYMCCMYLYYLLMLQQVAVGTKWSTQSVLLGPLVILSYLHGEYG